MNSTVISKTAVMQLAVVSLLALGMTSAQAAEDEATTLEEVVVTATRNNIALDKLPAAAIVIDRATIERFAGADLSDLLRQHAGLDVARNGGPGATTSLFIRGTESNHVLLLIDGVEMNPGSIGGPALQHIPLENIERIEIIKGPRSSLYGSEAIGGVINIITRRANKDRVNASVTAGSFKTQELNAGYHGVSGDFRYGADIGRQESDGYPPRVGSDIDRGYERDQVNVYAGWRGETAALEIRHWQAEGVSEYLGFSLEPLSQEYRNSTTSIDARLAAGETWSARLRIGNAQDETIQQDANFLGEFDFVKTDRDTLDWQHDLRFGETQLLTAGIYLEDSQVRAQSFGSGYNEETDVTAVYLQDVISLADDNITVSARSTDHDGFDRETTWNAGWNHSFSSSQRVFVSAGTGFRAPDATDRFGFGGNPDLEPETSRNVELGYRVNLDASQSLELTAFRNDIDDLIAFVDPDGFGGPLPGSNINVDEARIEGLELGYQLRGESWHLDADAIVQDPVDVNTDSQLARRARRALTLSYVHEFGDLEIGMDALARSERPDSPFNNTMLPGYGIVSSTINWRFDPAWSLAFRVQNIGDKEYSTAAGFRSEERSYYLTVRYSN